MNPCMVYLLLSIISYLRPQRTTRFTFKGVVILLYGIADGHNSLHICRLLIDVFSGAMKLSDFYKGPLLGNCVGGGVAVLGVCYKAIEYRESSLAR